MRMIQTFHSDYSVEQVKMLLSSLCEKFSFIIPTEGRIGYNLHGPFLTLIYVPKEMRMVRKYKALLLQGRDGKAVIYGTYWIPIWEVPFYAAAMALLAFFLLGVFAVLPSRFCCMPFPMMRGWASVRLRHAALRRCAEGRRFCNFVQSVPQLRSS